MASKDYSQLIFSGHRRVFFLTLAFIFLAQAAVFLQNRIRVALDFVNNDFKIAVVLNNASSKEAQQFKTALLSMDGVTKVTEIDPQQTIDSFRRASTDFSALARTLNPDFLPAFFELKVTVPVMLNPKVWVRNNIASMEYDAAAYYKEDHAKLGVYINAIVKFADIIFAACIFSLVSFGFFVEAYYTKITTGRERAGGLAAAFFAFVLAYAAVFILVAPVNKIYPAYVYSLLSWRQAVILAASLLAGWTLSKWKKF
jgi:cell division protein FtsX